MLDFGGGILSWKCPIRVLGNWAKNWNPKWFPYTEIDKFLTLVSIWKSGTPEIFERWIIDLHTRIVWHDWLEKQTWMGEDVSPN